jgi:hypothetical protein
MEYLILNLVNVNVNIMHQVHNVKILIVQYYLINVIMEKINLSVQFIPIFLLNVRNFVVYVIDMMK